MNILVIGNGFDLEHNLKITYNVFLNFSKWIEYKKANLEYIMSTNIKNALDAIKEYESIIDNNMKKNIYLKRLNKLCEKILAKEKKSIIWQVNDGKLK